jgi:hypothetical protein
MCQSAGSTPDICGESLSIAKELPSAFPVNARGGAAKPNCVTKNRSAEGNDACHRVPEERRIIMLEPA